MNFLYFSLCAVNCDLANKRLKRGSDKRNSIAFQIPSLAICLRSIPARPYANTRHPRVHCAYRKFLRLRYSFVSLFSGEEVEVSLSHGDSSRALVVTLSGILMLVVAN